MTDKQRRLQNHYTCGMEASLFMHVHTHAELRSSTLAFYETLPLFAELRRHILGLG